MNLKMTPALELEQLSYAYGEKVALKQLSFSVQQGECCLLLGPNGAGKSTLFSLITNLFNSRQGQILIDGVDIKKDPCQALAHLGVVFQQSTLDLDLTVLQNLQYHAALHGIAGKRAATRIQQELDRQQMYQRRHEKVRQLNGGHRRRVEIARALLHNPSLLLLDEPTVGLDLPSRDSLVKYIHSLSKEHNIAVLWATHLIDEIYPSDQLVILSKGEVKARGTTADICSEYQCDDLSAAFQRLTVGAENEA